MQIPTLTAVEAELCKRSLVDYLRLAWPIVEPAIPYTHGWHIDAIADHLTAATNGQIRNLIINMPPRHMKSLLCAVFWFTWVWTFRPATRWLYASYSAGLSVRDSVKCRRIIEHPWYQDRFGDQFRMAGDQNLKSRFENDKTGLRLATGVGGAATGEGGDFIIVDDPHKALDAQSTALREEANAWWDETMSTRGNNPKTVVKVVIMQRLHEQDLTGHLLDRIKTDGQHYEHLCLPAEYERQDMQRVTSIGWKDPRREPGALLWPERFGPAELKDLKSSLGSYGTAGQLQQRPAPDEGGIFKKVWWRYWRPRGVAMPAVALQMADGSYVEIEADELPLSFDEQIQSWDMTFKDTKSSDFVAGQVWGRVAANKYLLDYFLERADLIATIAAVLRMTERWPKAIGKLIEDKANGPAVISTLRNRVTGLIAVEPEGGKIARAYAVQPQVEAGNVYLPHPALFGWVDAFRTSCAGFPNLAHDDDVDAMTQALTRFEQRYGNDDSTSSQAVSREDIANMLG